MPDAHRTRSLVCKGRKHTSSHHRYVEHSDIPCAMVVRLIRDLPGVPGFLATVVSRIITAKLDPSVGQRRGIRTTRFRRPLLPHSSGEAKASIASRAPRLVTIGRNAPLAEAGMGRNNHTFLKNGSTIFSREGLIVPIDLNALTKSVFSAQRFFVVSGHPGKATHVKMRTDFARVGQITLCRMNAVARTFIFVLPKVHSPHSDPALVFRRGVVRCESPTITGRAS